MKTSEIVKLAFGWAVVILGSLYILAQILRVILRVIL